MASGIIGGIGLQTFVPVSEYMDYKINFADYFIPASQFGCNSTQMLYKNPIIVKGQDIMTFNGGYYVANDLTKPGINSGYRFKYIIYLALSYSATNNDLNADKQDANKLPAGENQSYPFSLSKIKRFTGRTSYSNVSINDNTLVGSNAYKNYGQYYQNFDGTLTSRATIYNSQNNACVKIHDINNSYLAALGISDELIGYNTDTQLLFGDLQAYNFLNDGNYEVCFNQPYAQNNLKYDNSLIQFEMDIEGKKQFTVNLSMLVRNTKPTICPYPWQMIKYMDGGFKYQVLKNGVVTVTDATNISGMSCGAYIFTGVEHIGG